jgi:LPS-assembly lipoprotein
MKRRAFLVLTAALPLAGCGFQLRGSHTIPYRSIYLDVHKGGSDDTYDGGLAAPRRASVEPRLAQALRAKGVTIAATAKEADAILTVSQEKQSRTILSLSGAGRVREYRLNYSLTYGLAGKDGKEIFPDSTFQSMRDFTYDDNLYLAKAAEEEFLYHDLQDDAIQQILRRLATSH